MDGAVGEMVDYGELLCMYIVPFWKCIIFARSWFLLSFRDCSLEMCGGTRFTFSTGKSLNPPNLEGGRVCGGMEEERVLEK